MLTHHRITSASDAVDYYSKAQSVSLEGKEEILSGWYGKGAEMLGLKGKVDMEEYRSILEGKINDNGKNIQLGIRVNDQDSPLHAPGTDFTFAAPKSVSNQLNMEGGDPRINKSLLKAAKQTFDYIEKDFIYTRTKINGEVFKEKVDNLVGAYFIENLNRENEFHSHVHFTFANMVKKSNGDWRSPEFRAVVDNKIYLGSVFRMNLAHELVKLGYEIDFTDEKQHFFEIKGYNKEFNQFTSQRTQKIIDKAKEIDPTSKPTPQIKQIANILTRQNKKINPQGLKELTRQRIKEFYDKTKINITNNIKDLTKKALSSQAQGKSVKIAKEAVGHAIEHCSERRSVFSQKDIIKQAMSMVEGRANLQDLQKEIKKYHQKNVIITNQKDLSDNGPNSKEIGEKLYTTRHALEREKATIELMNKGRGAIKPILSKSKADKILKDINQKLTPDSKLNQGQLDAAKAILTSKDRVHGIQGYAGTGKTYMLSKVAKALDIVNKEQLKKNPKHINYELQGLAPSGAAVKELQKVGIKSQTLQGLLAKYEGYAAGRGTIQGIQEEKQKFTNKIFVTDEASMIDASQMKDFMVIADKLDLRTAFMGDIRQLPSVGAGRPVYEMQRVGMSLVKMTDIRRQEGEIGKAIAYSAYARDFQGIFDKVGTNLVDCSQNNKEEVTRDDLAISAASLYNSFDKNKRSETIMVSQSNDTKNLVNQYVRQNLIQSGELGKTSDKRTVLINDNPTIAQREIASTYKVGENVILFNKANKNLNIEKNEYFKVSAISQNILELKSLNHSNKKVKFNLKESKSYRKHIELYRQEDRDFRKGDQIMFTRKIENPKSNDTNDLTKSDKVSKENDIVNSTLATIKDIQKDSYVISIKDKELKIPKDSKTLSHIDYSYCRTTHKAQGATAKNSIIIAESWYKKLTEERNLLVQVTRHKDEIYMVIDNKTDLIQRILYNQDNNKASSIDFLAKDPTLLKRIELSQSLFNSLGGREEYDKYNIATQYSKDFNTNQKFKDLPTEKIDPKLTKSANTNKKETAQQIIDNQNIKQDKKEPTNIKLQRSRQTDQKISNPSKKPRKSKYLVPEFSPEMIQEKFKQAIYEKLDGSDFTNLDQALDKAFTNLGQKQYFGKKKKGEIKWHGKAGYAKDYKLGGETLKWGIKSIKLNKEESKNIKFHQLTKEEIQQERQEQKLREKKLQIEKKQAQEQLSKKATQIYNNIPKENNQKIGSKNNYLNNKGIKEYSQNQDIKFKSNGDIVIPVKDINGKICTLQTIEDSGQKRKMFLRSLMDGAGNKTGNFFAFNPENLNNKSSKSVILAEGFATAASIDKAVNSGLPQKDKVTILVCFDAGNISSVLKNMKENHPDKNYIIAADNDSLKGQNTGEKEAIKAAQQYGAKVISPKFTSLAHRDNLSTDFNDLHKIDGIKKVREQLSHKENYQSYRAVNNIGKENTLTKSDRMPDHHHIEFTK